MDGSDWMLLEYGSESEYPGIAVTRPQIRRIPGVISISSGDLTSKKCAVLLAWGLSLGTAMN
jgi:hypothetical protein